MAIPVPTSTRFQPYVAATQSPAEFTAKAIVIGVLFGLLFGASTVYLGLRAGASPANGLLTDNVVSNVFPGMRSGARFCGNRT